MKQTNQTYPEEKRKWSKMRKNEYLVRLREHIRYEKRKIFRKRILIPANWQAGRGWQIEKTQTKIHQQQDLVAIGGLMGWALGRSGGRRSSVQCRTAKIPLSRSKLRLHSPKIVTFCLRISLQ